MFDYFFFFIKKDINTIYNMPSTINHTSQKYLNFIYNKT